MRDLAPFAASFYNSLKIYTLLKCPQQRSRMPFFSDISTGYRRTSSPVSTFLPPCGEGSRKQARKPAPGAASEGQR